MKLNLKNLQVLSGSNYSKLFYWNYRSIYRKTGKSHKRLKKRKDKKLKKNIELRLFELSKENRAIACQTLSSWSLIFFNNPWVLFFFHIIKKNLENSYVGAQAQGFFNDIVRVTHFEKSFEKITEIKRIVVDEVSCSQ